MRGTDIFLLVLGVGLFLLIAGLCLRSCNKQKCKDFCSIWCVCVLSFRNCAWCRQRISSFSRRSGDADTQSRGQGISTVGEEHPGLYNVSYEPPSYESVIAEDKDPELPSYEEALSHVNNVNDS